MSCKVLSIRSPSISLRQSPKETEKNFTFDNKPLTSSEMEIISRINIILEDLKELEQNFTKLRQDILKKNTIEGRENNKICAVQGKIISKNPHNSLVGDIESLSKMFHDQSKKITQEITSISLLSKNKSELTSSGSSSSQNTTVDSIPNIKFPELPQMRQLKTLEIKSSSGLKEKIVVPFTLKAEPIQEGAIPKTLRPEILSTRRPMGSKSFTFPPKLQISGDSNLTHDNFETKVLSSSPSAQSSLELNQEQEC